MKRLVESMIMDWRCVSPFARRPAAEWFDRTIEVLLTAILVFSPLALGVVHAWSEEIVLLLSAGMGLVLAVKLALVRPVSFVWTWAYVAVVLFLLVAAFQLVPLPASWAARLSPETVATKADLLGDHPSADETLSSTCLTFYPHATRHGLRWVLAAGTILAVVANVYRRPERIKRLLATVAIVGGGVASLALAQNLAGNGMIYWCVATGNHASSGPFFSPPHFGQFMNLSIGAALGLLCVLLHEAFTGRYVTPAAVADYLASPAGRPVLMLIAVIVMAAAAVFLSLSRGAMISMLIAAGFTTLMMSRRRSLQGQGWIMVLLATGAFICILYVGFDQVYDRLAVLRDSGRESGGRWQIVRNVAMAWTRFPVFGVGLGTREVVYPMFDRATAPSLAMHAENEYAQIAEEVGAAGLLSLVFLGIVVWRSYARNIQSLSTPIRSAAYGLGFGLLAVMVHSLSDFGQHLPANAALSAICLSLLIVMAQPADQGAAGRMRASLRLARWGVGLSVAVLAAAAWSWSVLDADAARRAEASWRKATDAESHLAAADWRAPAGVSDQLIEHVRRAAAIVPDNVEYRHRLGVYRWRSLAVYLDPNTGELAAHAVPWARQIVEELRAARPLCPTFGLLYCLSGEIRTFVLKDPNGVNEIRMGYRLSPHDATTCFAAARVDAEQGRVEEAFDKLSRAVQLDDRCFLRAAQFCIDELGGGSLALQLAGGDPDRLGCVADLLTASLTAEASTAAGDERRLAIRRLLDRAREEAFGPLKQRCEKPGAPAQAYASLASLYRERGDLDLAIQHYRQAVRLDYDQVTWRYALAQLLAQTSSPHEAIHEARICLRFNEDYAPAKELLRRLTADSVTQGRSASIR